MAHRILTMADSRRSVTDEEIVGLIKSGRRPVWTSSSVAEEFDITRQTAHARLKQLEDESTEVMSMNVGQATAYYVTGIEVLPGDNIKEQHRHSIIQSYSDRFVGLESEPWTAIHPNDGPAEGGDKIQLFVEGVPGEWNHKNQYLWENRREELQDAEISNRRTQALVSGKLYEKPTTLIEHIDYSPYGPDWDLEKHIGINKIETEMGTALLATGVKRHWIQPWNDAVFLTDVEVDWISPQGEGQELPVWGFDASGDEVENELIEEAKETAVEDLEEDTE